MMLRSMSFIASDVTLNLVIGKNGNGDVQNVENGLEKRGGKELMTSESIKKMKKAMIARATKGYTLTQIKQIISEILRIDDEITYDFKQFIIKKAKELENGGKKKNGKNGIHRTDHC